MTQLSPIRNMGWLKKLVTLEPALVRGIVGALVAIGLVWGVDFTGVGEQISETADIVGGLVALLTPWWTRAAVTPAALVVEEVKPDGTTVAGPASPLPTGTPISKEN